MARPREPTATDPPVESEEEESGDEEEEVSEGESESDSEPEGQANAKKPPSTPPPASKKLESQTVKSQTQAAASSSSGDEEDSGSETDTESTPKKSNASIKPIASKPMNEPEKTTPTKPRSKSNASGPTSPTRPTTSAGSKRPASAAATPAADTDAKRSKKKSAENSEKKGTAGTADDEGKKLFARLWSEDDEIAVLKGMIDYSAKKKADPVADLSAFHEFIRSKINIDVTRTQLQDKIRRLRRKFQNNAGKEKKNGKERNFSNPHEQKAYELSKKIWGTKKNIGEETAEDSKTNGTAVRKSRTKGEGAAVGTTQKIQEAEAEEQVKQVMKDGSLAGGRNKSVSFISTDGRSIDAWYLNEGMEFMKEDERIEMENKWKQYRMEEAGLLVKKLELSLEHVKMVLAGLKSAGH